VAQLHERYDDDDDDDDDDYFMIIHTYFILFYILFKCIIAVGIMRFLKL